MGNIAIVTLAGGALLQTQLRVLLAPAKQVVQHAPAIGKDVPGVLKNGEADIVLEKR
jgi:hypothetical protein